MITDTKLNPKPTFISGKTQGHYPKINDIVRIKEQNFKSLGKAQVKSLEFWSTVFDLSILDNDPYIEKKETIKALHEQAIKIPVWEVLSQCHCEEQSDEAIQMLINKFPNTSESALKRDLKAYLKMVTDESPENILNLRESNLDKKHLIETGFARANEGIDLNEKYNQCPKFKCEYLTIDKSPATGTKAIRAVVKHLITGEEIKENSIEQFMIEKLFPTRHHKKSDARRDNLSRIKNICDEMETFIHRAENKSSIEELYIKLKEAPYGLTKPIISLLLLEVLLKQSDKVSLFEKGIFQLEITELLYERLMANPQNFEFQKNVFDDKKNEYLEKISKITCCKKTNNLLEVTKSIFYKIKNLDKFTQNTSNLSPIATKFRNAVLNAKEPYKMIFKDLPTALEYKLLTKCDKNSSISFIKSK